VPADAGDAACPEKVRQRLIPLAASIIEPRVARMAGLPRERGDRVVALIGLFKLAKSSLLTVASLGWLLRASPAGGVRSLLHAVHWSGALPGHHVVREAAARLGAADDHALTRLAIAGLCYAGVFAVEGVGLLRRKLWAEWLTVVVTASFLPVELYELIRHRGPGELAALVVNAAIVATLVVRRLQTGPRPGTGARLAFPGRLTVLSAHGHGTPEDAARDR
jgi:uncharacterized membrane protein (DUF2068 family)